MIEEMRGRIKCWTLEKDKWGRDEYVKESKTGTTKHGLKIRLHELELKAIYGGKGLDNRCPMCQSEMHGTE